MVGMVRQQGALALDDLTDSVIRALNRFRFKYVPTLKYVAQSLIQSMDNYFSKTAIATLRLGHGIAFVKP